MKGLARQDRRSPFARFFRARVLSVQKMGAWSIVPVRGCDAEGATVPPVALAFLAGV
jgi:hypothetical protein